TTVPFIATEEIITRIALTATPSAPFLSPRPTQRPAASAAASVTRTSSMARLRSGERGETERSSVVMGACYRGCATPPTPVAASDRPSGRAWAAPASIDRVSQSPGRYQTSMAGMTGAMIVLVACVIAFVLFRETTRDVPEVKPAAIDWTTLVTSIQAQDHEVVHPAELEDGWIATNIEFLPKEPVTFGLSLLTEEGRYVGLRQED